MPARSTGPGPPGATGEQRPGGASAGRKLYRTGTHRTASPRETCDRLRPALRAMGITRLANVTGLDRLDIPVVMVCRPNSRSLAVSQGKGVTLAAARASGLMEAVEMWHAEHILAPLKLATLNDLRFSHRLIDCSLLPRLSVSGFHPDLRLLWIEGRDLLSGEPLWCPYEMAHVDFTLPLPPGSGSFVMSSNGLASGNHLLEATCCALWELIERDATSLWLASGPTGRPQRRLDLETVDDPTCIDLLDRLRTGGVDVGVWDTTTDTGISSFYCEIVDRRPNPWRLLYTSCGMGCHTAREVALARALTEAAQTRLTNISGSRDDRAREAYEQARNPDELESSRARIRSMPDEPRSFLGVPTRDSDSFEDDLDWTLHRLQEIGIEEIAIVDLTRPEFAIPVVRAIVPGLEPNHEIPGYRPGPRARRVAAATR